MAYGGDGRETGGTGSIDGVEGSACWETGMVCSHSTGFRTAEFRENDADRDIFYQ
jgi:hypothetical protein